MARTYTKFIPLVQIKRNGKHYSNYNEIEENTKRVFELKNTGINPDDVSRETYSKGNRTELKLDPEQLAKIEIFRELGIKYSWSDDDFITDKKY